ncbi:MAG: NAD(+) synthase [Paludibacteraceae bacterium]|nr:NAD(+) synthase [Paludibacteraceae bacterium]
MQERGDYGFVRVAAAIPTLRVGDCAYNAEQTIVLAREAESKGARVVCFPELGLTAYTCADLFFSHRLLDDSEAQLSVLCKANQGSAAVWIVGLPVRVDGALFNCAAVIAGGSIAGVVPKTHLPNNAEFYEKRWFRSSREASVNEVLLAGSYVPFGADLLFELDGCRMAIELCEDLWCPLPPSTQLAMHGAELILNLSASNELIGKHAYRQQLVMQQSARTHSAYVYVSSGVGESTQDLVFAADACIAENGSLLGQSERFVRHSQLVVCDVDIQKLQSERMRNSNFLSDRVGVCRTVQIPRCGQPTDFETSLLRSYARTPFVPADDEIRKEKCAEIFNIQATGLAKRWEHTHSETLVIGISGGLDSTLALLVAVRTADLLGYDRQRVVGVTMPGFGTTDRTYRNAVDLMYALGVTMREVSIAAASMQHFEDIGHDPMVHDVTYENTQARERTQILMDLANQLNGLVVGTGDLSELALGWATYNGDHMSMYAVNSGVPKTLVRYMVISTADDFGEPAARILRDIYDTPVSPELLPKSSDGAMTQITEDLVGPYELHDFFLYHYLRFGFSKQKLRLLARKTFSGVYADEVIDKWLDTFMRRFFNQQFKRSCLPDGPKVGSVNLSPRGDWRMPSDAVCFENL